MKKRILCRALIGAPIGLAISTAITIFLHSYTVTEIIIRLSRHWWSSVEMKLMRSWRR